MTRNKLSDFLHRKEQINKEIESMTKTLKRELGDIDKKIGLLLEDKSIHIIERYKMWIELADENYCEDYIPSGNITDKFFDGWCDRYQTYSRIEILNEYLLDGYLRDFDLLTEGGENDLLSENGVEIFNKLDEDVKNSITEILEEAIEEDIDKFKFDWLK